jgi:hypothetical protein
LPKESQKNTRSQRIKKLHQRAIDEREIFGDEKKAQEYIAQIAKLERDNEPRRRR